MGNGPAVRGLLDLQKKEDPDVLFLSEMKMRREKLEGLKWKLGMPNKFVKDCEGLSGGLAIFWKNTINLRVLLLCPSTILTLKSRNRTALCGGLRASMGSQKLKIGVRLGSFCALSNTKATNCGYVLGILTRCCSRGRRKEVLQNPRSRWICLMKLWRHVSWMILALYVILSPGEIIAMMRRNM
jgi:hypothetical protein